MDKFCVVVANGAKARWLFLEKAAGSSGRPTNRLLFGEGLINHESKLTGSVLLSSSRSRQHVAPCGGQTHTYDDHRQKLEAEYEKQFAGKITDRIVEVTQAQEVSQLVMIADPRMLELLRDELGDRHIGDLKIREVEADLTRLSAPELLRYLADRQVLSMSPL
jgi:protein required for attachment to host cells